MKRRWPKQLLHIADQILCVELRVGPIQRLLPPSQLLECHFISGRPERAEQGKRRKGARFPYLDTASLTLRETPHPGSVPSSD